MNGVFLIAFTLAGQCQPPPMQVIASVQTYSIPAVAAPWPFVAAAGGPAFASGIFRHDFAPMRGRFRVKSKVKSRGGFLGPGLMAAGCP